MLLYYIHLLLQILVALEDNIERILELGYLSFQEIILFYKKPIVWRLANVECHPLLESVLGMVLIVEVETPQPSFPCP